MKFGIFYEHSVNRPWDAASEYRIYQQALEQVEHHFLEEYSHGSAPEVFLAACAARTKNIHLGHGACMILPPFNDPVRCAERAATLDIMSNGRSASRSAHLRSTNSASATTAGSSSPASRWVSTSTSR